jgi:hypothetical protein
MRVNFSWYINRLSKHNTCNICHAHDSQHESLHSFGIGSPTCLKLIFYVNTTPQSNLSHVPKDFSVWWSFTKDYKVSTMVFTIIFTFSFVKASYSNMIFYKFW